MATYTARIRSREPKADPKEIMREFGGTEQIANEHYVFDDLVIAADSDEQAVRLAHRLASKRNMIILSVQKTVYRREERVRIRRKNG